MKHLYKVEVSFTYYVLAESEDDAQSYCDDAFRDEGKYSCSDAHEVTARTSHFDWSGDTLVYGADTDTTLDEALASVGLSSVSESTRRWKEKVLAAAQQQPKSS
jgi:hypothetical protein